MEINDGSFQKEVLENKNLVMVDFWAPWCMPCQMIKPMIEELGEQMRDKVDVKTLNVDENKEIADRYNIKGIPAILFFKNGEVVKEMVGMQSKEAFIEVINELSK